MKPVTPRTCDHLVDWCWQYQSKAKVYNPREVRFAIGFYQISQGMAWKIANPVRWQSFCAAAMHFIMCASAYGIVIPLPETLEYISEEWKGWEHLLFTLGKAQQQIVYAGASSKNSTRVSRFSEDALRTQLYVAVEQCFALVPSREREPGCYAEMHILTGDLPERKP